MGDVPPARVAGAKWTHQVLSQSGPAAGLAAGAGDSAHGTLPAVGAVGASQAGVSGAGIAAGLRGLALIGSGATVSHRMTGAYCGSPGRTTAASLFASLYCALEAGSIMMRAAKAMPSSCFKPWITRFCLAVSLTSCGLSPRALSIIARKA